VCLSRAMLILLLSVILACDEPRIENPAADSVEIGFCSPTGQESRLSVAAALASGQIECGFTGSRGYAITVQEKDAARAMETLRASEFPASVRVSVHDVPKPVQRAD
jgi:hypothetical protein